MPTMDLKMEQAFRLRQIEDLLENASKEDIVTVFLGLQKQNFILQNNVMNLVKHWNTPTTTNEEPSKSWTSFGTNI